MAAAGVADRCRIVGGDFFDHVPRGADIHILKSVIHDWDDKQSATILKNCRVALDEGGRLLLVERALPERAKADPFAVMLDVNMRQVTGGRERSEEEYRALLHPQVSRSRASSHSGPDSIYSRLHEPLKASLSVPRKSEAERAEDDKPNHALRFASFAILPSFYSRADL